MKPILAALALAVAFPALGAGYVLETTPTTVAWGNYDATTKRALRIKSGDSVTFHTLITSSPAALEKGGSRGAEAVDDAVAAGVAGIEAR